MSSENNVKTDKELESEILSGGGDEALGGLPDLGVSQLQADLEKVRDLALRSQADFENYRKRSIREREEAVKFATNELQKQKITYHVVSLGQLEAGENRDVILSAKIVNHLAKE